MKSHIRLKLDELLQGGPVSFDEAVRHIGLYVPHTLAWRRRERGRTKGRTVDEEPTPRAISHDRAVEIGRRAIAKATIDRALKHGRVVRLSDGCLSLPASVPLAPRRPMYEVLVACYAGELVTPAEDRRRMQYLREQAQLLEAIVPDAEWGASPAQTEELWRTRSTGDEGETYREEVQQKLDAMTVEELRTEVRGMLFLLMMADDIRAELEGTHRRERRQHQRAGGDSGQARQKNAVRLRAKFEKLKWEKYPTLSRPAAVRKYLQQHDKAWATLTGTEQQLRVDAFLKRMSRAKKYTRR